MAQVRQARRSASSARSARSQLLPKQGRRGLETSGSSTALEKLQGHLMAATGERSSPCRSARSATAPTPATWHGGVNSSGPLPPPTSWNAPRSTGGPAAPTARWPTPALGSSCGGCPVASIAGVDAVDAAVSAFLLEPGHRHWRQFFCRLSRCSYLVGSLPVRLRLGPAWCGCRLEASRDRGATWGSLEELMARLESSPAQAELVRRAREIERLRARRRTGTAAAGAAAASTERRWRAEVAARARLA